MVVSDGYSLVYNKGANQIVITMPQTMRTLSNTMAMVTNRKIDLSPSEKAFILNVVRFVVGREDDVKPVEENHWVQIAKTDYKCSNCGVWWSWDGTQKENGMNYCPNCGADMRGNNDG